ncbi:MAG: hypothetical protein AAF581_19115 [Planctomycetota bacterium]
MLRNTVMPTCLAGFLVVVTGCSNLGLGEMDAVDIAREVTKYRKRGNELLKSIEDERRRDGGRHDPIHYVDDMKEASSYFGEAVALAEASAQPRQEFARSLQLIGNTYYLEYVKVRAEMAQLTTASKPVPETLVQRRNEAWASTEEYLKLSNREYQYYVNYIHGRNPQPAIFNELRANFEILQYWEDAAHVTRVFLSETRGILKEEQESMFRKMLNVYDDKVSEGAEPDRP